MLLLTGGIMACMKKKQLDVLNGTDIEEQFRGLCFELFAASELPYNPYPWLAKKLQVIAERFEA